MSINKEVNAIKGFCSSMSNLSEVKVRAELINRDKKLSYRDFNFRETATTDVADIENMIDLQLWFEEESENQNIFCNRIININSSIEYD